MGKRSSSAACLLLPLGFSLLRAAAAAVTENVSYHDGNQSLTGFIAYPSGATGQLPVVIHVHAWGGLTDFEKERARRTADELGLVGFAVSIYTDSESAQAATGGMQARAGLVGRYSAMPHLFVSRLGAAMALLRNHSLADAGHVAAAGYCFGGSAVLQFAKHGGAHAHGVHGVFSFHGGLSGLASGNSTFGNVKVVVANGQADNMIPMSDGSEFQAYMTDAGAEWEFATYGKAGHGFTHPTDGTAHFHYERLAEARSWEAMSDALRGFGFFNRTTPMHAVATANITYNDSGVPLSGFLAYPAGATGRLPVVIHVHTWAGLSDFERERARRTASELGYIGFAVSMFTDNQTAQAQAGFMARMSIVQGFTPELHASRLTAAVNYLRGHALADISQVGASGYCFGGSSVLHYARLGAAAADGVAGVVSFHGGLSGMDSYPRKYCPTRVAIYNGAADDTISDSQIESLAMALEHSGAHWEFTNYSNAGHGFTHPRDGTAHFNFEQVAEQRSWASMADFFNTTFAGHGRANSSTCVHEHGGVTTTAPAGACADDNAGVAAVGGSWGITSCRSDLCSGNYAAQMRPLCRVTCGLCTPATTGQPAACADDNAGVAQVAGSWGVTSCAANYCSGQYASMIGPLCPVTCGTCTPSGDTTTTMPNMPSTTPPAGPAPTTTEVVVSGAARTLVGAAVTTGAALLTLVAQLEA